MYTTTRKLCQGCDKGFRIQIQSSRQLDMTPTGLFVCGRCVLYTCVGCGLSSLGESVVVTCVTTSTVSSTSLLLSSIPISSSSRHIGRTSASRIENFVFMNLVSSGYLCVFRLVTLVTGTNHSRTIFHQNLPNLSGGVCFTGEPFPRAKKPNLDFMFSVCHKLRCLGEDLFCQSERDMQW